MKLKGEIGMGRPSGCDPECIRIEVRDQNSRISFLSIKIGLEDFARALTGQWAIPVDLEVQGLEYVGKVKETKPLVIEMPQDTWKEKELAEKLAIAQTDEGWRPSLYFDSQSSFFTKDGKRYAQTHQYRYVKQETANEG